MYGSRRKQFRSVSKKSNTSKRYPDEFKRDAVELALSSDKTVTEVARDLGVSPEGLRGWVKQAKTDRGEGPAGALTTAEREELVRLRKRDREQQQTIEILKKGLAFFMSLVPPEVAADPAQLHAMRAGSMPSSGSAAAISRKSRAPPERAGWTRKTTGEASAAALKRCVCCTAAACAAAWCCTVVGCCCS
jgi:transposase